MKTIYFKTWQTLMVSQEIVEIINKRLNKGDCPNFLTFVNNEKVELLINVSEMLYIQ